MRRYPRGFFRKGRQKISLTMDLAGVFFLLMCSSGCVITAASGTRTEYEDRMKAIEKDYMEKRITQDEYILLKNQAGKQTAIGQNSASMSLGRSYS